MGWKNNKASWGKEITQEWNRCSFLPFESLYNISDDGLVLFLNQLNPRYGDSYSRWENLVTDGTGMVQNTLVNQADRTKHLITGNRDFDGNDYFRQESIDTKFNITGSMTMIIVLKPDDGKPASNNNICGKWEGGNRAFAFIIITHGVIWYLVSSNGGDAIYESSSSAVFVDGPQPNYIMIDAVYNAEEQTIDLGKNGEIVPSTTTGTIPTAIYDSSTTFMVGALEDLNSFYNGKIKSLMMFNRAVSRTELKNFYKKIWRLL